MKKAFLAYSSYLNVLWNWRMSFIIEAKSSHSDCLRFEKRCASFSFSLFLVYIYIYKIIDCVYWKCYDRYFVFIQMQW